MSEGHEGESTRLHCGHAQVMSRDLMMEDLTGADGVVRTKTRHEEVFARYIEENDEREGEKKTVEHSHGAPPASRSRLPSSSSQRHLHSRSVCIQVGEVVFCEIWGSHPRHREERNCARTKARHRQLRASAPNGTWTGRRATERKRAGTLALAAVHWSQTRDGCSRDGEAQTRGQAPSTRRKGHVLNGLPRDAKASQNTTRRLT